MEITTYEQLKQLEVRIAELKSLKARLEPIIDNNRLIFNVNYQFCGVKSYVPINNLSIFNLCKDYCDEDKVYIMNMIDFRIHELELMFQALLEGKIK